MGCNRPILSVVCEALAENAGRSFGPLLAAICFQNKVVTMDEHVAMKHSGCHLDMPEHETMVLHGLALMIYR